MAYYPTLFKCVYHASLGITYTLMAAAALDMVINNNFPFDISGTREVPIKVFVGAGSATLLIKAVAEFVKVGCRIHEHQQECAQRRIAVEVVDDVAAPGLNP